MAGTLFFAAMLFYGWSVGSGLDRSGNVTMAANSPEGSRPLPTNIVILFGISSVPSLQRRNKTSVSPVNYSIPSRYPWGTTSYASAR